MRTTTLSGPINTPMNVRSSGKVATPRYALAFKPSVIIEARQIRSEFPRTCDSKNFVLLYFFRDLLQNAVQSLSHRMWRLRLSI